MKKTELETIKSQSKCNIALKLNKIMIGMSAIIKDKNYQGIKYRSIESIYQEVHPLFENHKVTIIPTSVRDYHVMNTESKLGSSTQHASYVQSFMFIDCDSGEFIEAEVACEGTDSKCSGKGTRTAFSYAMKSLLESVFLVVEKEIEISPIQDISQKSLNLLPPKIPPVSNPTQISAPSPVVVMPQENPPQKELFDFRLPENKTFLSESINNIFRNNSIDIEKNRELKIAIYQAVSLKKPFKEDISTLIVSEFENLGNSAIR